MIVVRRVTFWRVVPAVVLLNIVLIAAPANSTKNEASCTRAGVTVITRGVTLRCKESYGKLKWVNTKTNTRTTRDRVDNVTGFQIKAIYVVPSDGVDNSSDTNGDIAGFLDEGNRYLRDQLGLQLPIDQHANANIPGSFAKPMSYDIQYLKSKLSTSELRAESDEDITGKVFSEIIDLENPSLNRRNYILFVEVDVLQNGTACGFADKPGMLAFVALGRYGSCRGKRAGFEDAAAMIWIHELFHNFGVDHTLDDPCDLMEGFKKECDMTSKYMIDRNHSRYVGSSVQGQDILLLPVWEGFTDRPDSTSSCFPLPRDGGHWLEDGINYAQCPIGTKTIAAREYCQSWKDSAVLEEFVGGQWKNLGSGTNSWQPWGPNGTNCGDANMTQVSKKLTVTTPGVRLYRWLVNGYVKSQLKVIWVR